MTVGVDRVLELVVAQVVLRLDVVRLELLLALAQVVVLVSVSQLALGLQLGLMELVVLLQLQLELQLESVVLPSPVIPLRKQNTEEKKKRT